MVIFYAYLNISNQLNHYKYSLFYINKHSYTLNLNVIFRCYAYITKYFVVITNLNTYYYCNVKCKNNSKFKG